MAHIALALVCVGVCVGVLIYDLRLEQQKEIPVHQHPWPTYFDEHLRPVVGESKLFDFPLGGAEGEGAFLYKGFREDSNLGEDWSVVDPDEAQIPVCSCARGVVILAQAEMADWGGVVIVAHAMPFWAGSTTVEILYSGLADINVSAGDVVDRGQQLGFLDRHDGVKPVLHWEVRNVAGLGLGPSKSSDSEGWLEPSVFIREHRPKKVELREPEP